MSQTATETYRVNAPAVISETLDGEAVIMDLRSGTYFSTSGIGAVIWSWLESGANQGQIVAELAKAPRGDTADAAAAVGDFIRQLKDYRLIVANTELHEPAALTPVPEGTSYTPPVIAAYSDMEDLLLIDVLHEVDEEIGWPAPRPNPAQSGSPN